VSGTVSWTVIPVIRSTTSLTDSRCWMFIVVITSNARVADLLDVLPALW